MPGVRMRRLAVLLGLGAVVLGVSSVVGLFWVSYETDNGLLCEPPFTDEPGTCSVYDIPFWMFAAAAAAAVLALVAFVVSLAPQHRRRR